MVDYTQQQRKPQQPGQQPAPSPAQRPPTPAMGQPPTGVPQGGAPRPASPMAPQQMPQSNARMGGVMGSPQAQAQPWAQANQQQAGIQEKVGRNYYGEQPQNPATDFTAPDYAGMQADWQQQAQIPDAPEPIQQNQLSVAPGVQQQRKQQQRSYYGEL